MECSFVQKEYLDVLVALANPDINLDKIKTKVISLKYLGTYDSWKGRYRCEGWNCCGNRKGAE